MSVAVLRVQVQILDKILLALMQVDARVGAPSRRRRPGPLRRGCAGPEPSSTCRSTFSGEAERSETAAAG